MRTTTTLLVCAASLALHAQTIYDVQVVDNEFIPPDVTIQLGDAIHFIFVDPEHTVTEVSEAIWMANEAIPLPGGFAYGFGTVNPGTDFTITPIDIGTSYYICEFHVNNGMKGMFTVLNDVGVSTLETPGEFVLGPNPANDQLFLRANAAPPMIASFYDTMGKLAKSVPLMGSMPIPVVDLANGIYVVELRDTDLKLLATQRISIVH